MKSKKIQGDGGGVGGGGGIIFTQKKLHAILDFLQPKRYNGLMLWYTSTILSNSGTELIHTHKKGERGRKREGWGGGGGWEAFFSCMLIIPCFNIETIVLLRIWIGSDIVSKLFQPLYLKSCPFRFQFQKRWLSCCKCYQDLLLVSFESYEFPAKSHSLMLVQKVIVGQFKSSQEKITIPRLSIYPA